MFVFVAFSFVFDPFWCDLIFFLYFTTLENLLPDVTT